MKVDLSASKDSLSEEEITTFYDEEESVSETKTQIANMFDDLYYFEQADIGLPRAEIVFLNLSIRKLIAKTKIENVR